jgi:serine/threonine protein kinase
VNRRAPTRCSARTLRPSDPRRVGGYRLLSQLGSGGTADVFLAQDRAGRPAVVKVMRRAHATVADCAHEVSMLRLAGSDHAVPVHGSGHSSDGPFIAMGYLADYRPGTVLTTKPVRPARLLALGGRLARALAGIHERGIVHCDIKPANLLVNGGDVRLIDFGTARSIGEQCGEHGVVHCSRGWAAPEQLRADRATPAIDIFAWGSLIAFLAGGVHPFASGSVEEWVVRVQSARPDVRGLPPAIEDLVRQTLAREASQRPTAVEVAEVCESVPRSPSLHLQVAATFVLASQPDGPYEKAVSPMTHAPITVAATTPGTDPIRPISRIWPA